MQIKSLLKASFAVLAAFALAGCTDDPEADGDAGYDNDAFETGGEFGDLLDGETPLSGNDFTALAKVVPPASAGISVVHFAYNSSSIPASEQDKVRRAAAFLSQNPSVVVIVGGHCDERGTNEYNMSLGEFRAQSVREALAACGVDAGSRVQTASFGEESPVAFGHDEASWAQNRRAEFDFRQGPAR